MPGIFFSPVCQNGGMGETAMKKLPKNHDHEYELTKAQFISTLKDLMLLFWKLLVPGGVWNLEVMHIWSYFGRPILGTGILEIVFY